MHHHPRSDRRQQTSHDIEREEVIDRLASDEQARLAVAHRDNWRTGRVVVLARERPAIGPGARDGDEITWSDVPREELVLDDDVAALAVLAI